MGFGAPFAIAGKTAVDNFRLKRLADPACSLADQEEPVEEVVSEKRAWMREGVFAEDCWRSGLTVDKLCYTKAYSVYKLQSVTIPRCCKRFLFSKAYQANLRHLIGSLIC